MAGYNITRSIEELLSEHELSPPSFTVHLHPDHWTLNGGSKFLYNNQIASLLDDIRAQRIPTDFIELFEAAKLPFYDGCMIVELLDYRPLKGKEPELANPKRSRVVLSPTPETMWADICLLNHKAGNVWTDEDALQVEAKILLATTPPLCLDPDPHLTRIANSILRVSAPAAPVSLKRKAVAMEPEEDESEKVRRAKIMQYMNPRTNRSTIPSYRILDVLERIKQRPPTTQPANNAPAQVVPSATVPTAQLPIMPSSYPLAARATPAPPVTTAVPVPHATATPVRKSVTPAPPTAASPSTKRVKTPEIKKAVSQSPVINARPPSTVPPAAAAIPPHMQQYQTVRSTPSPPSHGPRPPSTAITPRSPMPTERPLSAIQPAMNAGTHLQPQPLPQPRGKTPMPQRSPVPRVPSAQAQATPQSHHPHVQPQTQPQVQAAPPQQPVLPQSISIQQQPVHQNVNPAAMLPNIAAARRATPQQPGVNAPQTPGLGQHNPQQLNPAYYQYYVQQQQRINQANQLAAAQAHAAGAGQNLQLPQRNSPAGRAQQQTPRPTANPQQPLAPQQGTSSYAAMMQNHLNNANLRPVVHGTHAQLYQQFQGSPQAAAAAGNQQAAQFVQEQGHLQNAAQSIPQQYQQQLYNYAQMQQQQQRLQQQGYQQWPGMGMGRGMMPNIANHQQMQLGAGRAGMQGSS